MKLGVLIYLENNEEQVLMIHRSKNDEHQGLWLAPGGKVEPNEAPYETASREMLEETGLQIKDHELRAVLSFPDNGESPSSGKERTARSSWSLICRPVSSSISLIAVS